MIVARFSIDAAAAGNFGAIVPEKIEYRIDPPAFIRGLDEDDFREVMAAIAEMPGTDIVDALEDHAAQPVTYEGKTVQPLTDRGTVLLDCMVARAQELDRLPEDYVSPQMRDFAGDIDRLHEAICDGRTADACALLREMCPDHDFMSDAARLMLADGRARQEVLL